MAHGGGERQFKPIRISVLTVSDSRDEAADKSGRLLVDRLKAAGHCSSRRSHRARRRLPVRAAVSRWIAIPT